ncbi:uncharacterized protein LOC134261003 [Saccostrea cucullata]|uniref:uncharacterized protein LOC134261003 n=1 Tax=Saccostrea cuccullata TaxID=36930 RepID=UPI002ED023A6
MIISNFDMNHIPRLSNDVYVGLCHEIGTPDEIRLRRDAFDILEELDKPLRIKYGLYKMKSGSKREGFNLSTSDEDWMLWPPNHKVICDLSQTRLYRIPQHTVILMESENLPPGFTRLKLISPSNVDKVISSRIEIKNEIYISSTLFRDNHMRFLETIYVTTSTPIHHGPCSSFVNEEDIEEDYAFCFRSHHWPKTSLPWIQRCYQQGWPSEAVVSDILSGGFHVVPIGSTPAKEEEWRISFSLAEQKLVYSMNHCQFLCYGLFKIFLKEVINFQNHTPVLCSYFTKTVVFWVIQSNRSLTWSANNLLPCFWECFKLLIHWVHTGECPNFFIPQNNMFRLKVTGFVQTSLYCQLYDLYKKGISCLLLSETLRSYLSKAILDTTMKVCSQSRTSGIPFSILMLKLFNEIRIPASSPEFSTIELFAIYIKQIENVLKQRLSLCKAVVLQCITSDVLKNSAFLMHSKIYPHKYRNKDYYKANKVPALLKQSCALGYVSNIMYLAIHFYGTKRYEHSLSCLQVAQRRMSMPYIMYFCPVNEDIFTHCIAEMSLSNIIKKVLVSDIALNNKYTYIDELVTEQRISESNGRLTLYIPPMVMLHLLFILNHHRLGDTLKAHYFLRNLQILLHSDDSTYKYLPPTPFRDISWQILGICQQICGDYLGSLHSYHYSLQQEPTQRIQEATLFRMNSLSQLQM